MTGEPPSAREWRLSTKLILALALSMVPLGVLAIMLAMRNRAAFGAGQPTLLQLMAIGLPLLMWLAALATGWFAIHRLIIQPLAAMQQIILAYGYSSEPARTKLRMRDARLGSVEMATLANSFDAMADAVDAHSRDLRGALAEQRRLTREVHHRVKNNLQIVSSLLSLQARSADTPEVVKTYAMIQARIQALTQVHRWMYDDATSHGVDLRALVADLCTGLETSLASIDHPRVTLTCDVEAIIIHPDTAVPVAFLVTEIASLAQVHGEPGPLAIRVHAAEQLQKTTLTIAAPGFVGTDHIAATSLHPASRIVHGMARQLRSSIVHDPAAGAYSVVFAATPA